MTLTELIKALGYPDQINDVEYMVETQGDKFYFIDAVPFVVEEKNAYKLDQFEDQFTGHGDQYCLLENYFVNTLEILWLYNDFYVEIRPDILDKIARKNMKRIELKKILRMTLKFYKIEDLKELKMLVKLTRRTVVFPVFYLYDYKIVIYHAFCGFLLYIRDDEYVDVVREIVNANGLYLRKYEE